MARILIVDGHAPNREYLCTLLGYCGHELLQAEDGEEGLRLVRSLRPHLVIADVFLPSMNGDAFVARLRGERALAALPIIFYTPSYGESEARVLARACGVRWVLTKPSQPEQVLSTVRQALTEPQAEPLLEPQPTSAEAMRGSPSHPLYEVLQQAEASTRLLNQLLDQPAGNAEAEQVRRLGEQLTHSLASLQSVSLRLTSLIDLGLQLATERDPDDMLQLACRVAHNMSVCKSAAIGILDASGHALTHYVVRGGGNDNAREPDLQEGPFAQLTRQKHALRLQGADAAAGPGVLAGQEESFLGVPVASAQRVYGWLVLCGKLGAPAFSDVDERIASTVAAQLAVAWENLVLYRQIAAHHDALQHEADQRRAVDEDLRRFRLAMDTAEEAIMLIDPVELRFIDFNAATSRLFGYTDQELRRLGPMSLGAGTREQLTELYNALIHGDTRRAHAEITLQKKDGTPVKVEVHRRPMRSGEQWIIVAVARDLSEREAERERSMKLAHFDTVTGLANRSLFMQALQDSISHARPGVGVVLLLLDLDRFQMVNDRHGHSCGDELLRQVADRLLSCLPRRDTVGRLGADEFGILLSIPDRKSEEAGVLERIRATLAPRFSICGSEVTVTASIGVALYPDDAGDAETLMKYADTAMHWAKEDGRNAFRYFTGEMNRYARARLELENALRTAIEQKQFQLVFQPRVNIASGLVCSAEVLLRWDRPGRGTVSPAAFIPLLEETGLVVAVGRWVMEETCRMLARWRDAGFAPLQLSFNVSARQFFDEGLEDAIRGAIQRYRVDARYLMLELPESALMSDVEKSAAVLDNLKRLGLSIALDDFGTGYSSLAYLRRFPIDALKIDIAFIRDVCRKPEDAAIVSAVINMAHSLRLLVVAEGVEDAGQLAFLREHGCDEIQGYWYSRALSAEEFQDLVQARVELKYG